MTINKVILVGNLGRDPEVRSLQNGGQVANLSVATSESWKDRDTGERKERTEWHRVVIWGDGLVKIAEQYLRKGSKVYLEGQLQTRKWTDQGGAEKYTTEVVVQGFNATLKMLDEPQQERQDQSRKREPEPAQGGGPQDNFETDIPF